jgi:hypothetical protein
LDQSADEQTAAVRDQQVKTQVGNFFTDLGQSGTLLTLSGVPLLLSGLISLYVRRVALPRSRFQAYEELVQLLLEIHPSRRAQAALDRAPRFAVLADASLRKQTLAYLAYHKRWLGFDAGCPFSEARTIIVEYLQSLDGAGLPPREAIAGAKELLSVDADTAGLVIERRRRKSVLFMPCSRKCSRGFIWRAGSSRTSKNSSNATLEIHDGRPASWRCSTP